MPPAPPKRPGSGSAPPRRNSAVGPRAVPRRAPEPDATARSMEPADEEGGDSTSPDAEADINNSTVVFNPPPARKGPEAGPQGKLIVLKGPKQGAEFTLGPGETSIGR